MTGEISDGNPSLGYIVWFTNAVQLNQKKNCNCFQCGSPDHLVKDCPKELGKATRKVGLNLKEGTLKKGGQAYQKLVVAQQATPDDAPKHTVSRKAPFLNPDPLTHWSGPENIAQVKMDDEGSWALLDSGSTIDTVTTEFIKAHSLDVDFLSNMVDCTLRINGFRELFSQPMGYVIRVQVEGVKGYNKDQVALVIPDLTAFRSRVPVTLGTPTIN